MSVFRDFYPQLVEMLPMDDVTFLSKLYTVNLLPGNVKDQVQSMNTSADKAAHFLDHVIKPSVTISVSSLDDLIKVMEDGEYDGVKKLAKLIRRSLRKQPANGEAELLRLCGRHVQCVSL